MLLLSCSSTLKKQSPQSYSNELSHDQLPGSQSPSNIIAPLQLDSIANLAEDMDSDFNIPPFFYSEPEDSKVLRFPKEQSYIWRDSFKKKTSYYSKRWVKSSSLKGHLHPARGSKVLRNFTKGEQVWVQSINKNWIKLKSGEFVPAKGLSQHPIITIFDESNLVD